MLVPVLRPKDLGLRGDWSGYGESIQGRGHNLVMVLTILPFTATKRMKFKAQAARVSELEAGAWSLDYTV